MIDVTYVNHRGEKLLLTDYPFMLQGESLFNYNWSYSNINTGMLGGHIKHFYKDVTEFDVDILVHADTKTAFQQALNRFFSVVEPDVMAKKPGRLVLDDGSYMICYMITSKKSLWRSGIKTAINGLTVVTEYPFWCKEVKFSYNRNGEITDNRGGYDFPYDFPYDYNIGRPSQYVMNKFYTDCNFEMTIFGNVETPQVRIGSNLYKVFTNVGSNDYLRINSREKTITLHKADGQVENVFNDRSKEDDIFAKIAANQNLIESNSFFDLTIYQERSEPEWNLL